jgi:DNA-binding NarL/FixJ family response regulator
MTFSSPHPVRRALIVDDHPLWRRELRATLFRHPRWKIVGEASNGIDAVQQAKALRPDLILLDVGLPTIDGIEAARRILAHDPRSRILFLSAHESWDIAEAVLTIGARGYIGKTDVARRLLPAMEAIADGKLFFSAHVAERAAPTHEVMFSSVESTLLDAYADFSEAALTAGSACIFVAANSRRGEVHRRLAGRGVDVDRAIGEGRLLSVDVVEALATYMVGSRPDELRCRTATTSLFAKARAATGDHVRVAACGECAPHLWEAGNAEAAIQVERLWDDLARESDVDVFCAYVADALPLDKDRETVHSICAAHSAVHVR